MRSWKDLVDICETPTKSHESVRAGPQSAKFGRIDMARDEKKFGVTLAGLLGCKFVVF